MDNSKTPKPGELNVEPIKDWPYGKVPIISCPCDMGSPEVCSAHQTPPPAQVGASPRLSTEEWEDLRETFTGEKFFGDSNHEETDDYRELKQYLQKAVEEAVVSHEKYWREKIKKDLDGRQITFIDPPLWGVSNTEAMIKFYNNTLENLKHKLLDNPTE